MERNIPTVPTELFTLLDKFNFPGNIRQLRSMVVNAISQHRGGVLSLNSFRQAVGELLTSDPYLNEIRDIKPSTQNLSKRNGDNFSLKAAEATLIRKAMASAGGNQGIAAQLLGITRQTLNRKLKHLSE